MIIYSETISLDRGIEQDWLQWMKKVYIPQVMETELFESNSMMKLLDPIVDDQMVTYNVQYACLSMAILRKFEREHQSNFNNAHKSRYGNRFVSFQTILEKI
ncbi:MAG: DUF4286 family protein [Bacteroidota bacterium]